MLVGGFDGVAVVGEVVVAAGGVGLVGVAEPVVDDAEPVVDDGGLPGDGELCPVLPLEPGELEPVTAAGGEAAVPDDVLDPLLEEGGLASRPLLASCVSISCWTPATSALTAAGVPPAPSADTAFSCFRSAFSCASSAADGWEESVSTS